jgi:nitrile hydratase accessory protein
MSGRGGERVVDMEGSVALPRRNGELVFDAPWESRAFGLAVALHERGAFEWPEFQSRLAEAVAHSGDGPYYRSWVAALERLLLDKGLLERGQLEARAAEFEAEAGEEA